MAPGDPDTDGRTNLQEFERGTNPNLRNTDDDGFFNDDGIAADTDPAEPCDAPVFPVPIGHRPFNDQGAASTLDLSPGANRRRSPAT